MKRVCVTLAVMASVMLAGGMAEAKKPIVAVFNIEFQRVRMNSQVQDALRDYIETKLTSSGAYRVVPPGQLKKALSQQKVKSFQQCYKSSCQIKIGEELSADRTLSTRVTRIGGACVVSMKLYHLKSMTTAKGDTAEGPCGERGIMASIRKVLAKLKAGGGSPGTGGPGPAADGPSVSGGAVTSALGRLIVRVRPMSSRVRVTGPGNFSSTGGSNWERASLKPGTYQVLAGAPGYTRTTRSVTIGADDLKTLTITLERPGTLVVTGQPAGARVEISGPGGFSVIKGLPVTVGGAPRGTYQVKVTRAGYRAVERVVVVSPGKRASLTVTLVKSAGGAAGISWVSIPGGSFSMGSHSGAMGERPVHQVVLQAFSMMKTEVTVRQYRRCVRAGSCNAHHLEGYEWPGQPFTRDKDCNWVKPGHGAHPINCVDWNQARTFCRWAGGRLPSEAQWEFAARSRGRGWKYPWGNGTATCSRAVMGQRGGGCSMYRTWPVCSKTAGNTIQGVCDMAGNVWEWTEDCWHDSYNGAPSDGRAWKRSCMGSFRVRRGGGWRSNGGRLRTTGRNRSPASYRRVGVGLRCVR